MTQNEDTNIITLKANAEKIRNEFELNIVKLMETDFEMNKYIMPQQYYTKILINGLKAMRINYMQNANNFLNNVKNLYMRQVFEQILENCFERKYNFDNMYGSLVSKNNADLDYTTRPKVGIVWYGGTKISIEQYLQLVIAIPPQEYRLNFDDFKTNLFIKNETTAISCCAKIHNCYITVVISSYGRVIVTSEDCNISCLNYLHLKSNILPIPIIDILSKFILEKFNELTKQTIEETRVVFEIGVFMTRELNDFINLIYEGYYNETPEKSTPDKLIRLIDKEHTANKEICDKATQYHTEEYIARLELTNETLRLRNKYKQLKPTILALIISIMMLICLYSIIF